MGYNSSRLYYQEKDHKNIYYQGNWHEGIYYNGQNIWDKQFGNATGSYFYVTPPVYYGKLYGTNNIGMCCTCDPRRRFLEGLFNDPSELSIYRSYCNDKYMITRVNIPIDDQNYGKEEIRVVRGCLDSKNLLFDESPSFYRVGCANGAFLISFSKNDSYIWRIIDTSDYENITYKEVGVLPSGYGNSIANGISDFFVLGHQSNYNGNNGNLKFIVLEKDGKYQEHTINIPTPSGFYGDASCGNFCVVGEVIWLLVHFGGNLVLYKTDKNFSSVTQYGTPETIQKIYVYPIFQSPQKVSFFCFGENYNHNKVIHLYENQHYIFDTQSYFNIGYSNFEIKGAKTIFLDVKTSNNNYTNTDFGIGTDGLFMPCFCNDQIYFGDENGVAFMSQRTLDDGYTYTYLMCWTNSSFTNPGQAIVIRNNEMEE